MPVGCLCICNNGNGFDDNLFSIISSSIKVHADTGIRCLNGDDVRNIRNILIRNEPFVRIFRSNDGVLRNRFPVLWEPMSSKSTSIGVETDGVCAFLAMDGFNLPDLTLNERWRLWRDGHNVVNAVSSGIQTTVSGSRRGSESIQATWKRHICRYSIRCLKSRKRG